MKKKTVYEAEDSSIFDTEADCIDYENRQNAAPKIAEWVEGLGTSGRRATEYIRIITQWEDERDGTLGGQGKQKVVNIAG